MFITRPNGSEAAIEEQKNPGEEYTAHRLQSMQARGSTLALKPRGDVTRSPKQKGLIINFKKILVKQTTEYQFLSYTLNACGESKV